MRSADFVDMYNTKRGHPLTSSTRSRFSIKSLDGMLDKLRNCQYDLDPDPFDLEASPEETESALEEETESRMRESELWIKGFL